MFKVVLFFCLFVLWVFVVGGGGFLFLFVCLFVFGFFFLLFRATPAAYGSSQVRVELEL